jgi:cytochrome c peroxidase
VGWLRAIGIAVILYASVGSPVRGSPAPRPIDGPRDAGLAALGREIFFDPSLSASGTLACAGCHDPHYAYGPPPGRAVSQGGPDAHQPGTRAVPSLRYLRSSPPFALEHHFIDGDVGPVGGYMWDGRAASIHDQARLPLLAPNEMANGSIGDVVRKLSKARYASEFRSRFGRDVFADPERAFQGALDALDAFQATPAEFFPYSSRYDAFLRGEIELTAQEERGVALFKDPDKGNCASCHLSSSRDGRPPIFTDYDFANVGVPRNPHLAANADPDYFDLGLCGPARKDLEGRRQYCGFFRAPGLRNVAARDAFFHNAAFSSLREAVKFYVERDLYPERYYSHNPDGSVHKSDDLPRGSLDNLDHDPPLDRPPGAPPALSDAEIDDVVAFLGTLTDADVAPRAAANTAAPRLSSTKRIAPPWTVPPDPTLAAERPDEYAWRAFIALNWPANAARRRADARRSLGAPGPVVWESWQNAADIFLEDGRDPGAWIEGREPPAFAEERRFETASLKDLPNLRHIVGGHMVPLEDPVASARRLTETRMNRAVFDYIRAHELYNIEGQVAAAASADGVHFPAGAMLVKARWRPIRPEERTRYHTVEVRLADGSLRLYGLTALHLATKVLPQWLWATFEHIDNRSPADGEGWQLPSRDTFACAGSALDCERTPPGLGIEGTVWANYRLRGTLSRFVDDAGRPLRLANSDLEAGLQESSSCMSCHARSALGVRAGIPTRLSIFQADNPDSTLKRRGFLGQPQAAWFADPDAAQGTPLFHSLDFVWSLVKARPRRGTS